MPTGGFFGYNQDPSSSDPDGALWGPRPTSQSGPQGGGFGVGLPPGMSTPAAGWGVNAPWSGGQGRPNFLNQLFSSLFGQGQAGPGMGQGMAPFYPRPHQSQPMGMPSVTNLSSASDISRRIGNMISPAGSSPFTPPTDMGGGWSPTTERPPPQQAQQPPSDQSSSGGGSNPVLASLPGQQPMQFPGRGDFPGQGATQGQFPGQGSQGPGQPGQPLQPSQQPQQPQAQAPQYQGQSGSPFYRARGGRIPGYEGGGRFGFDEDPMNYPGGMTAAAAFARTTEGRRRAEEALRRRMAGIQVAPNPPPPMPSSPITSQPLPPPQVRPDITSMINRMAGPPNAPPPVSGADFMPRPMPPEMNLGALPPQDRPPMPPEMNLGALPPRDAAPRIPMPAPPSPTVPPRNPFMSSFFGGRSPARPRRAPLIPPELNLGPLPAGSNDSFDWRSLIPGILKEFAPQLRAAGGPVRMMRGGYPELYTMPVRRTYASGGDDPYLAPDGTGGRSDKIEARLSPGEYVMDAETMSLLGDGDNEAGARKLDKMRSSIRRHKGKALAKGKISPNAKKSATEYLGKERR